jgi:lysophospholipase L1-like esterase
MSDVRHDREVIPVQSNDGATFLVPSLRRSCVAALAIAVVVSVALPQAASAARTPRYYIALGDSFAASVQPDASGSYVVTSSGYAEDLQQLQRRVEPNLELRKFGCGGETTASMISGGGPVCASSQLDSAVTFLNNHTGQVSLITIDIGINDLFACFGASGAIDSACVTAILPAIGSNLRTIVATLRGAAGPGTRIVGSTFYDPVLFFWLAIDQQLAEANDIQIQRLNRTISDAFAAEGVPVADVAGAFATGDFTDLVKRGRLGVVPLSVARVCAWTWQCAPPPQGPDTHPNDEGYEVMASAFERVLGS